MNLNVKERLILLSILPQEGSYTTLKIVRQLKEDLSFSEEEHEKYNFNQTETGGIVWNNVEDVGKDVEIGKVGKEIICKALKKLDEMEKLNEDSFPIFIRFVEEEEE